MSSVFPGVDHLDGLIGGGRVSDDQALAVLYVAHFPSLVRLAMLLVDDVAVCEDIAQEAYVRVSLSRARLRDPNAALAYLRQTVVNLSRSALRRRMVARKHAPGQARADSTDDRTQDIVERDVMVRAVRCLPRRQREAVSLRYYADLTEAQAAQVMGVSVGAVKSYTSRGLAQLAQSLEVAK